MRNQQDDSSSHHRRKERNVRLSRERRCRERAIGTGFFLRRAESTTVSPTLNIHSTCSTIHGSIDNKLLEVPVTLIYEHGTSGISKVDNKALIDSGSEGEFIDQNFTRSLGLKQTALEEPIKVFNIDGTQNKRGTITHYTELDLLIGERIKRLRLYITGLGKQKVLLGYTWLWKENPDINWKQWKIRWRPIEANEDYKRLLVNALEQGSKEWIESCGNETLHPSIKEIEDEDEWMNSSVNPPPGIEIISEDFKDFNKITIRYLGTDDSLMDIWNSACPDDSLSEIWINATLSPSQKFAIKQEEGKKSKQRKKLYYWSITNIWTSFRKKWNTSPRHDHGTMLST